MKPMRKCVCTSTPPGSTRLPVASITRAARRAAPGGSIARIVSPAIRISARVTPSGVTTSPPAMARSTVLMAPTLSQHLPRDDDAEDLRRAAADLGELRIAEVALHVELHEIAPAAHDPHAVQRRADIGLRRPKIGQCRLLRVRDAAIDQPGAAIEQQPGGVDLHLHVDQLAADELERRDRLAEL